MTTQYANLTNDQIAVKKRWYEARLVNKPHMQVNLDELDAELLERGVVETNPGEFSTVVGYDVGEPIKPRKGTVVANHYKERYGKDRGCGDWLHQFLAARTLDSDRKLIVSAFDRLLEANGIDPHGWNRTTSGWQGRLRMSGRRCLETVAKKTGQIQLADGTAVSVPPGAIATKPQVNA